MPDGWRDAIEVSRWTEVWTHGIDPANRRSRRLFERAGFVAAPAAPGAGAAPIAMTRRLEL